MQKNFNNGNEHDGRTIMIKIEGEYIEFFFYDQYRRHEEWVHEEIERRFQNGQDELEEDQKTNYNFYWIGIEEWIKSKTEYLDRPDNWHTHMKEKRWFTNEMEKYIDDNTKPNQGTNFQRSVATED